MKLIIRLEGHIRTVGSPMLFHANAYYNNAEEEIRYICSVHIGLVNAKLFIYNQIFLLN